MNSNYMNGIPEQTALPPGLVLETLRSVLTERGEITLPATGFSMGPIFQASESLVIRSCSQGSRISLGTIVVFERNERWVAHRLWLKWGDLYLTGGDATWALDWPPLRRHAMEGAVVAFWFNGRRIELESEMAWWQRSRWVAGGILRLLWKMMSRMNL
jgi:hypothetical protein